MGPSILGDMSKGKRKPRREAAARAAASSARPSLPAGGPARPAEAQPPDPEAAVRLKALLGIRPGTYLTVLYGLVILFVLFMLLFFKGIRDQGTYLQVTSFPAHAAVEVDGMYAGSTPCEILVRRGSRTVRVSKPFFHTEVLEERFGGRVFGTLFVRPRRVWQPQLRVADPAGLTRHALQDLAANPQIPEIMGQTVAAAYRAGRETREGLAHFADNAKYFVTNPLQFNELLAARLSLDSGVQILTPTSLLRSVHQIIHNNVNSENFPFWLTVVLPEEASRRFVESASFTAFLGEYQDEQASLSARYGTAAPSLPGIGATQLLGLSFWPVPAGTLIRGASEDRTLTVQIPHPVSIRSFAMSENEVPASLYQRFLADNPEWRRSNLAALVDRGWVSEDYLEGWQDQSPASGGERRPVTHVSYYAAEAFCRWLSAQLPASLAGNEIRLPSEAEWEWAARGGLVGRPYPRGSQAEGAVFFATGVDAPATVGTSPANAYGLRDMAGNVWEWCSDWYSPVRYLFTSWDPERNAADSPGQPPTGFEKVVRGGSWANERELVRVHTRGSQPPDWCTPFLGFRVVLARVER